jgi:hypothetical protein
MMDQDDYVMNRATTRWMSAKEGDYNMMDEYPSIMVTTQMRETSFKSEDYRIKVEYYNKNDMMDDCEEKSVSRSTTRMAVHRRGGDIKTFFLHIKPQQDQDQFGE